MSGSPEPQRIEDLLAKTERLATLAAKLAKRHKELCNLFFQQESAIRELRAHVGELESTRDKARKKLAHIYHQLPAE